MLFMHDFSAHGLVWAGRAVVGQCRCLPREDDGHAVRAADGAKVRGEEEVEARDRKSVV